MSPIPRTRATRGWTSASRASFLDDKTACALPRPVALNTRGLRQ